MQSLSRTNRFVNYVKEKTFTKDSVLIFNYQNTEIHVQVTKEDQR